MQAKDSVIMKPGKRYLANHCSNLEYKGTFMFLGQVNTGVSSLRALSISQVLCLHLGADWLLQASCPGK